ncbi:hypothetical protein V7S43_002160 [Phytophthora oleae]|uniref:Uncharacterized protein n=1 Tax=Phytophthora oleae TaxID=2107226 RepID=A0ABD3G121_9STRA
MPWLARHDPVITWEKRTLVRFNNLSATESDGPVSAARAPAGACGSHVEAAAAAAASDRRRRPLTTPGVVERKCVLTQKSESETKGHLSEGHVPVSVPVPVLLNAYSEPISKPVSLEVLQASKGRADNSASAPGADVTGAGPLVLGTSEDTSAPGADGGASVPGTDDAARGAGACKRPALHKLARSRAAELHTMSGKQVGLDCARQRMSSADDHCDNDPSKAKARGRGAPGARLQGRTSRRKPQKLRESRSGTETGVSAGQTPDVKTLNVFTRTGTGLQYQKMRLENPPTCASALTALPVMSWKCFARDLYDGYIEQICILSDVERVEREAEELKQLAIDGFTESDDPLSAKTKKQRFEEQS